MWGALAMDIKKAWRHPSNLPPRGPPFGVPTNRRWSPPAQFPSNVAGRRPSDVWFPSPEEPVPHQETWLVSVHPQRESCNGRISAAATTESRKRKRPPRLAGFPPTRNCRDYRFFDGPRFSNAVTFPRRSRRNKSAETAALPIESFAGSLGPRFRRPF